MINRRACFLSLVCMTLALASTSAPASAVVVPRIEPHASPVELPPLDSVRLVVPARSLTTREPNAEFETSDASAVAALRDARDLEEDQVTSTLDSLVDDRELEKALRRCLSGALRALASRYRQAAQNASLTDTYPQWPDVKSATEAAAEGCVTRGIHNAFPQAPPVWVTQASFGLLDRLGGQTAVAADLAFSSNQGAIQIASWLDSTAASVTTVPDEGDGHMDESREAAATTTASSSSLWPGAALALALVVGAAILGRRARRR